MKKLVEHIDSIAKVLTKEYEETQGNKEVAWLRYIASCPFVSSTFGTRGDLIYYPIKGCSYDEEHDVFSFSSLCLDGIVFIQNFSECFSKEIYGFDYKTPHKITYHGMCYGCEYTKIKSIC